ncbi:outer membrane protein [Roseisalinus antarcticus]|uniref:Outer membrane protein beta-barrel domain-containing protein n=1 Tax=Roseisalinus antarcticus TaxID=254357 RepID=A0A1Y5TX26_9RHOB|nr:outer membrane beta-barrel protein [Roseisalinus antarcticus]SLN75866.1 hypothetical protein ROA7023_04041 [Roseisalinus antarcticus]
MRRLVPLPLLALIAGTAATPLAAEVELSLYLGAQSAPHSRVTVADDPLIPDEDFLVGWQGRSFEPPPYYGLRATWWRDANMGFGADFSHAKVYSGEDGRAAGYETLEFTDGINILTANAYYRWPGGLGALTPYVGAGIGVALPHVEVTKNGSETFGYQYTGPALALLAGASYPLSERVSVFGEVKSTYSWNEADLSSGGTLRTNIVTNALNIGVSYAF